MNIRPKTYDTTLSVGIQAEYADRFKALSNRYGRDVSDLMRTALMRYLAEEEAKEGWFATTGGFRRGDVGRGAK